MVKFLVILIALIARSLTVDWTENEYGDLYYANGTTVVYTYEEAVQACIDLDPAATLVTVKSAEVENFISDLPSFRPPVLLGLKRTSNPSYDFQWVDGTPLLPTDYQNWINGTPASEECAVLVDIPTFWKGTPCGNVFYTLCQIGSDYTGTTTTGTLPATTETIKSDKTPSSGSDVSDTTTFSSSCACNGSSKEEDLKTYLIVAVAVGGGLILILVIVIIVMACHMKKNTDDDEDTDSVINEKRQRLASSQTNPSYIWNSLPSQNGEKLKRDIPRPSVIGSASTMSYYNKAFNRGPFSDVELDYLPEDKEYTLPSQPEYGTNNMYSKLNMIR